MGKSNRSLAFLPLILLAWLVSLASLASAQPAASAKVNAALAGLEALAQQTLEKTRIPGMAVAVVYRDQVVYLKGFGVRELGKPEAIGPDTVFQIASLSKPIASTVVAALVSDGVVGWDDPVVRHDPAFQLFDPWVTRQVTLRDMFCHRSGLPGLSPDLLEEMGYGRAEILYRLRYLRPTSGFRSQYAYNNTALAEGGFAAARAAGKSWEDLSAERLYRPLGMTSTSSRAADYRAARNRASLHGLVNGRFVAGFQRDPDAQTPAGGVSSTVRDLTRWMRLQLAGGAFEGKQIISARALGETHRPHMVNNPAQNATVERSSFYGLGWNVDYDGAGRVTIYHSGAFSVGASTAVRLVPSERLGIAVLTNAAPIGVPEAITTSFMELALDAKVSQDWLAFYRQIFAGVLQSLNSSTDYSKLPAQPQPALALGAYVGRYGNDFFGEVEVALRDGRLVLLQGPRKTPLPLRHYDRDIFVYQPSDDPTALPSGAVFRSGADGKIAGLLLEYLDGDGQGEFARISGGR